ncbi:uncharacterized protein LOC144173024 [Haemaphysalis longicornis]
MRLMFSLQIPIYWAPIAFHYRFCLPSIGPSGRTQIKQAHPQASGGHLGLAMLPDSASPRPDSTVSDDSRRSGEQSERLHPVPPPGVVHEYVSYNDEDDGTLARAPTINELFDRMVFAVFGHLGDQRRPHG